MEQNKNASNHRDKHSRPHEERESVIKRAWDAVDGYPNSDKDVEKRQGETLLSLSDGYMKKEPYQHERWYSPWVVEFTFWDGIFFGLHSGTLWGRGSRKNKRAMFLSVRLKVFIPQAICPVAKTLRKTLSYMKITSVSGLWQDTADIVRKSVKALKTKEKLQQDKTTEKKKILTRNFW